MSKTRICLNCAHYEERGIGQMPIGERLGDAVPIDSARDPRYTSFAPRCMKGLNPSIAHAPMGMQFQREQGAFEPDAMAAFCDSYVWAPPISTKFKAYVRRKLEKEPRLSTVGLSEKFVQWFDRGQDYRIKIERGVNLKYTEYGYVSISTGWQPVFLLVRSARSKGSTVCLEDSDQIIGYKHRTEKRYKPC